MLTLPNSQVTVRFVRNIGDAKLTCIINGKLSTNISDDRNRHQRSTIDEDIRIQEVKQKVEENIRFMFETFQARSIHVLDMGIVFLFNDSSFPPFLEFLKKTKVLRELTIAADDGADQMESILEACSDNYSLRKIHNTVSVYFCKHIMRQLRNLQKKRIIFKTENFVQGNFKRRDRS